MEEKDGLGDNLEGIGEGVKSFYVGEFMGEDRTSAGRCCGFCEVGGQIDRASEEPPDEWLAYAGKEIDRGF